MSTIPKLDELGKIALLLEECRRLRHENPEEMERIADLALAAAERLDSRRYAGRDVADAKAEAAAELGRAQRIRDRLAASARNIARAAALWSGGNRNPRLLCRIAEIAAATLCHLRRFPDAISLIEQEAALWDALGEREQAAERRVSLALYTSYDGDPRRALTLLCRVLPEIDPKRNPELALAAAHNVLWFMTDLGWFECASRLLPLIRPLYEKNGRHLNRLRLRWLEGRVAAGQGQRGTAYRMFAEAREGFLLAGLAFPASMVAIDIALFWADEGRFEDVAAIARELLSTFRALGVPREGVAALLLVEEAAEAQRTSATRDALRATAALLPSLSLKASRRAASPSASPRRVS